VPPLSLRTTFLKHSTVSTWGGFFVCAFLGAVAAFGLLTLGSLALLPAALAVWLVTARSTLRRSAFGLVAGVGVVGLYVAYVQRRGPGTVCWRTATASGCDQYLNPWPWLASGVALVLVGFIIHVRRLRSGS
jgi:hypothetical protein